MIILVLISIIRVMKMISRECSNNPEMMITIMTTVIMIILIMMVEMMIMIIRI